LHDLVQPLNRRERDAVQVGADDRLVVVAEAERGMKVLRRRAEQANARVGPLKFQVDSGIATSCSRTFLESTAAKFSLALRSLVHCQLATPGSRLQYWVTAPLAGLMATVNPTPPVARAPKKLFTDGWKSKFWESAQMNDPTVVAFARRPAAKL